MPRTVFLDESGDLGWTFTAPYRNGGSSRYLTLGYLIIPQGKDYIPGRLVTSIYDKYGIKPTNEKKGADFSLKQKEFVAAEIVKVLNSNPDFRAGAITVKKEMVRSHIRDDGNKLYNYMIKRSALDLIYTSPHVRLVRDERSIKVESGNSCIDYLQITLWFEYSVETVIEDFPSPSHHHKPLIFIDWLTNIVWSHYEDGQSTPYGILSPKIKNQTLFF
jgi:hypothetical protein